MCCDLCENGLLPFGDDDFVALGPSATSGLGLIFKDLDRLSAEQLVALAKYLHSKQEESFEKYKLPFQKWEGKLISLKNIEHSLGEFSKYMKISFCVAAGKGGFQKMRKRKK